LISFLGCLDFLLCLLCGKNTLSLEMDKFAGWPAQTMPISDVRACFFKSDSSIPNHGRRTSANAKNLNIPKKQLARRKCLLCGKNTLSLEMDKLAGWPAQTMPISDVRACFFKPDSSIPNHGRRTSANAKNLKHPKKTIGTKKAPTVRKKIKTREIHRFVHR